jgi:hypothetical protein
MLDSSGKASLFEFTKGPAFRFSPEHMAQLHAQMLNETVEMIMEIDECRKQNLPIECEGKSLLSSQQHWQQVYPVMS